VPITPATRRRLAAALATLGILAADAATAQAKTSHEGWPHIDGVLLMNKLDQSRPLDARPGQDLFGQTDPSYSCDGLHLNRRCAGPSGTVSRVGHNKLLGGHGNDVVYAGGHGDVIWGDYKPSGQPQRQVDHLYGGRGRDFIYASHGRNTIEAGSGDDYVKAHFGRGVVDCGGGNDTLYISRKAQRRYKIRHCETVSHKTLGY
jgi:Ca2+-binding RTX toxin-like protein